jgi:hypothetical protein
LTRSAEIDLFESVRFAIDDVKSFLSIVKSLISWFLPAICCLQFSKFSSRVLIFAVNRFCNKSNLDVQFYFIDG